MKTCENCQHWVVRRANHYGNGEVIERWKAPDGNGYCESLAIETAAAFGCNRFIEGDQHDDVVHKSGEPWQHFVMIDCPDCQGKGDGARGHRCAGTGKVRLYDDGYVGDEQTRRHPKEALKPTACQACREPVKQEWQHCPACGARLWTQVAETEVVSDADAGLAPYVPKEQR